MKLLSKLLMIAGLQLLTWHWVARAGPWAPPPPTPRFNKSNPFLQFIFNPLPSCKEGEIRTGSRCHRPA